MSLGSGTARFSRLLKNACMKDLIRESETVSAIRATLTADRSGSPFVVESLGEGWTAEEALSIMPTIDAESPV